MYVCICNAVTERQIRLAVRDDGVVTFRQLQARLHVATCCGRCEPCARRVLAEALAAGLPAPPARVVLPDPGAA